MEDGAELPLTRPDGNGSAAGLCDPPSAKSQALVEPQHADGKGERDGSSRRLRSLRKPGLGSLAVTENDDAGTENGGPASSSRGRGRGGAGGGPPPTHDERGKPMVWFLKGDEQHWHPVSDRPEDQPPPWGYLNANTYVNRKPRAIVADEVMRCNCGDSGCLDDETCLNRMIQVECTPGYCSKYCCNQRIQKRAYAETEVFDTKSKGWGIRALEDIPRGTFVVEYSGEICDADEFRFRAIDYQKQADVHFYFMLTEGDEKIDASRKSAEGRFANHSCNPNLEALKWDVCREIRVGLFATRDIKKGEELTLDYQMSCYGKEPQKCFCGEPNCRGIIGDGKVIDIRKGLGGAGEGGAEEGGDAEGSADDAELEEWYEQYKAKKARREAALAARAAGGRRKGRGDDSDASDSDDEWRKKRREREREYIPPYVLRILEEIIDEKTPLSRKGVLLQQMIRFPRSSLAKFLDWDGLSYLALWLKPPKAPAASPKDDVPPPSSPPPAPAAPPTSASPSGSPGPSSPPPPGCTPSTPAEAGDASEVWALVEGTLELIEKMPMEKRHLDAASRTVKAVHSLNTCGRPRIGTVLKELAIQWRLLGSGAATEVFSMAKVPRLPKELERGRRDSDRGRDRDRGREREREREAREREDRERERMETSGWSRTSIRYTDGPPPPKRPREGMLGAGPGSTPGAPSQAILAMTKEEHFAKLRAAGIVDPNQLESMYANYLNHIANLPGATPSSASSLPSLATATPSSDAPPPPPPGISTADLLKKKQKQDEEAKRHKQLLKLCLQFGVKHESLTQFRGQLAGVITSALSPFLKDGKISSKDDFKHLSRKMTHAILEKEIKRNGEKGRLEFRDSVEKNAKSYVQNYFAKHGTYVRGKGGDADGGGD